MGRLEPREHINPAGIPCRIILNGSARVGEIPARAVRLDRQGGVLHLVAPEALFGLAAEREVLVSFDLPEGRLTEPRRLCFRAGVRHVSSALAPHHWIGVSFQEAAICSSGQCCCRF
jgi:hypothetical protein